MNKQINERNTANSLLNHKDMIYQQKQQQQQQQKKHVNYYTKVQKRYIEN